MMFIMRFIKRYLYPLSLIITVILALVLSTFPSLNVALTTTPQPTATLTPFNSDTPLFATATLGVALHPIKHNTDWIPFFQSFDGFEMALVPVGCFMMGSIDGSDDEEPVNQQCFDKPYWIDRYEITNKEYGSAGVFKGDNRPRDSLTWFEARDFCAQRGAYLPTEREWEYAARGPDNLVYPWGNDFVADNVIYSDNSNKQTADVGSRPAGISWVGAYDFSGNVWEWVSTIFGVDHNDNYNFSDSGENLFRYPYVESDGREKDSQDKQYVRLLRGGSWTVSAINVRSAVRGSDFPTFRFYGIGFRCVFPYE